MARVHVDDDTWRVFKNAAGDTPISDLLGQLVTRHVHHYQARQAQAAALDDRDLLAALERAAGFSAIRLAGRRRAPHRFALGLATSSAPALTARRGTRCRFGTWMGTR